MVKKQTVNKSDDKIFKFFLIGFVMLIIIAAILLNHKDEQVIVVNQGDVVVHYFYLETCPHCKEQEEFHKVLLTKYPNVKIIEYEMTKTSSQEKYIKLGNEVGMDTSKISTPTTIIGKDYNIGFLNEAVTGKKLEAMIEKEINNHNNDIENNVDENKNTQVSN